MKQVYSIYCLQNKINGKRYIGLSHNPKKRMESHCKSFLIIGKAIHKYGWENFNKIILQTNLTFKQAQKQERYCIKKYNSIAPNGYNLSGGGEGLFNPTKEIREKKNKALKQTLNQPEIKAKMIKAQNRPEVKAKKSKSMQGNQNALGSHPNKKGQHKGNQFVKGKHWNLSAEAIEKMKGNQNAKGKRSAEARKNMKEAFNRPEVKEKMRKPKSKEAKANMKKAQNRPEVKAKHIIIYLQYVAKNHGLTLEQYLEQRIIELKKSKCKRAPKIAQNHCKVFRWLKTEKGKQFYSSLI